MIETSPPPKDPAVWTKWAASNSNTPTASLAQDKSAPAGVSFAQTLQALDNSKPTPPSSPDESKNSSPKPQSSEPPITDESVGHTESDSEPEESTADRPAASAPANNSESSAAANHADANPSEQTATLSQSATAAKAAPLDSSTPESNSSQTSPSQATRPHTAPQTAPAQSQAPAQKEPDSAPAEQSPPTPAKDGAALTGKSIAGLSENRNEGRPLSNSGNTTANQNQPGATATTSTPTTATTPTTPATPATTPSSPQNDSTNALPATPPKPAPESDPTSRTVQGSKADQPSLAGNDSPDLAEPTQKRGETAGEKVLSRGQANHGIDGAQVGTKMHRTADNGSELPTRLQGLPGSLATPTGPGTASVMSAAPLAAWPGASFAALAGSARTQSDRILEVLPATSSSAFTAALVEPVPGEIARAQSTPRLTGVDHLLTRIVNGAMQLRAVGGESMSVVYRPDAQTEMVLQLQMHQGLVDVEVRMQRGDGGALAQQWSQLQQTLAQQGIRLSALQTADAGNNPSSFTEAFDNSSFSQERQSPLEQDEHDRAPEPRNQFPATRGSARNQAIKTAAGSWESWA